MSLLRRTLVFEASKYLHTPKLRTLSLRKLSVNGKHEPKEMTKEQVDKIAAKARAEEKFWNAMVSEICCASYLRELIFIARRCQKGE